MPEPHRSNIRRMLRKNVAEEVPDEIKQRSEQSLLKLHKKQGFRCQVSGVRI